MISLSDPRLWVYLSLAASWIECSSWAAPTRTPEEEARWLLPRLKPVDDQEWARLQGPSISETVEVVPGDTLSGISQRLFGDPKYWPKIWALNNGRLLNPHQLSPGQKIRMVGGTGAQAPQVLLADATAAADPVIASKSTQVDAGSIHGSQEWRTLPRQGWELSTGLGDSVSVQGIDSQSRVRFRSATGSDLSFRVLSNAVQELGSISGGREKHTAFMMGDAVFIEPGKTDALQVGRTYSLVGPNQPVTFEKSKRSGAILEVLGQVKIIGVKDNVFIGDIIQHSAVIQRESRVIPLISRVPDLTPVAGPSAVDATVKTEFGLSTDVTAQGKIVALDRGVEDGVREGMIFRFYQRKDPMTGAVLTQSDFVINGEAMVVQVGERIALARVMRSLKTIDDGDRAVLLTDISDLTTKRNRTLKGLESGSDRQSTVEQVDQIDVSGGLGHEESKELRQLERYNEEGEIPTSPVPAQDPAVASPVSPQAPELPPATPEAPPVTAPELPPPPASAETLNQQPSVPDLSPPDELPPATPGELEHLDDVLNQP